MEFRIHLARENEVPAALVQEVVKVFNEHPGPVKVSPLKTSHRLPRSRDGIIPWREAFGSLKDLRARIKIPEREHLTLLTTAPNERNFYTVPDPKNLLNVFAHVSDFSWATTAPSWAIVTHFILKDLLDHLLVEGGCILEEAEGHRTARGCFSDFCGRKADLGLKLRTADICGECLQLFQSVGIPEALIHQLIAINETLRLTALSTAPYLPSPRRFQSWPFPVAITRHKAAQSDNSALRLGFLLDHFDSLVRYSLLAHELSHERRPEIVERPSLGWWVDQLARAFTDSPDLRGVARIAQEERIVALRNDRRGHGWMAMDAETYRPDCEALENAIGRIEGTLAPLLHGFTLVIPREIQLTDEGYRVMGEQLSGSHILHPTFTHDMTEDPRLRGLRVSNSVHLATHDLSRFWDCRPYLLSNVCPECRHTRLLITDGGRCYIDTFMGHRVDIIPGEVAD